MPDYIGTAYRHAHRHQVRGQSSTGRDGERHRTPVGVYLGLDCRNRYQREGRLRLWAW